MCSEASQEVSLPVYADFNVVPIFDWWSDTFKFCGQGESTLTEQSCKCCLTMTNKMIHNINYIRPMLIMQAISNDLLL